MKRMKVVKNVCAFVMALCMAMVMNVTALAESDTSPAVAAAREGVLQINLVYEDNAGNQYVLETGSGFLIGASTGAKTVVTNYHVVSLDSEQKDYYSSALGVNFNNANSVNLKIQVVVKRDVVISASYVNGSEKTDFAILELAQPIYDRSPLKIADSNAVVETQRVYALGFPWTTTAVADDQVYTSEDVTITNGIVGKFQEVNEIKYILHDAGLSYGNSGGPLVNSNGSVIGVNTMYSGDGAANYYYSVAISEITSVLDALGIIYEKEDASTPVVETPTEAPVVDPNGGGENNNGNNSTLPPVVTPAPAPVDGGSSSSNMGLIIGIIVGAVVLLVLIIVIIVVASSSKKNKSTQQVYPPMGMAPQPAPVPQPYVAPAPQPVRPTPPAYTPAPTAFDSGAGETSVLGGGAGETSVLSANAQPVATLIRKKNGETASITKALYVIGKERSKVDFCVPDNNSISRNHANIICRGGVYYIVDKNSTNFTFVNGNKITPGQEVKLNSGDKIKLADEEFEIRL